MYLKTWQYVETGDVHFEGVITREAMEDLSPRTVHMINSLDESEPDAANMLLSFSMIFADTLKHDR